MKVTDSVGCWRNLETLNLWVEKFCQKLTFVGTLLPSTQGWKVGHHVGLFVSRPHRKPVVMFFFLGQKTVSTLQLVFTDALKNEKPFKLFATETLLQNKDLAASLFNFPTSSHFFGPKQLFDANFSLCFSYTWMDQKRVWEWFGSTWTTPLGHSPGTPTQDIGSLTHYTRVSLLSSFWSETAIGCSPCDVSEGEWGKLEAWVGEI